MISGRALVVAEVKEAHNYLTSGPGHYRRINWHVVEWVGGLVRLSLIFFASPMFRVRPIILIPPKSNLSTPDGHRLIGGC